jgi:hypothetical protein
VVQEVFRFLGALGSRVSGSQVDIALTRSSGVSLALNLEGPVSGGGRFCHPFGVVPHPASLPGVSLGSARPPATFWDHFVVLRKPSW